MYEKKCEICRTSFRHQFPNTKACSETCRKIRTNKIHGRYAVDNIPSNTIGSISEMQVAVDLMRNGFSVFRALSQSCHCDLIATKLESVFRIEVKTGYKSPKTGKIQHPKLVSEKYDIFAAYERNEAKVYYFWKNGKEIKKLKNI